MADPTKQAAAAILVTLATEWGSTTPVAWPGQRFDPPDDGSAWMRPTILWGDGFGRTISGGNTIIGVLMLDVFAPAHLGEGQAYALAATARVIFNRRAMAPVYFRAPSGPVRQDESEWVHMQVTCPFVVDEQVDV